MEPLTLTTIKRQVTTYSDQELSPGAKRWGLTVDQERQRLGFLQSEQGEWPVGLRRTLLSAKAGNYPGVPTFSSDILNWSIVTWLKSQPLSVAA